MNDEIKQIAREIASHPDVQASLRKLNDLTEPLKTLGVNISGSIESSKNELNSRPEIVCFIILIILMIAYLSAPWLSSILAG